MFPDAGTEHDEGIPRRNGIREKWLPDTTNIRIT